MRVGAVDHLLFVNHVRLVTVQIVFVLFDRVFAHVTVEFQQRTPNFIAVVRKVFTGQQQRNAHESKPKQMRHVPADTGASPRQIVTVPSETGG